MPPVRHNVRARVLRAGDGLEPWLVGAFLVFFSAAIAAAMPQISAAVRAAVTDSAAKGQNAADAAPTVRVQVRLLALRFVPPPSAGGDVVLPVADDVAPAVAGSPLVPAVADHSRQIRARGIRTRAPPLRLA